MKNILVATDFSNEAYAALFYVTQLLATKGCTFHLIHVYGNPATATSKTSSLFTTKTDCKNSRQVSIENLKKIMHRIVLDTGNEQHHFKIISKKGILPKVIPNTIAALAIDLLVMGNKGRTGAKELFWGSNTIQIADSNLQCPLLAIPKELSFGPISEIALATDFKKGCSRKTLGPLIFLANTINAAIRIVHIKEESILSPMQATNKKLLKMALAKVPHTFDTTFEFADKAIVIQTFLQQTKIRMLAMAYQKNNFFERLLREPVIKDISIYAIIPLLILPAQD